MIPLSVPSIKGNEWQYVKDCLDTEWVSSAGHYVEKFEGDLGGFVGVSHAVACVNGTAALQVALRIVGVVAGDEVIVPTLTFIATVNAIRYLGGEPVFMDCDEYYNIDIEKTADFLERETELREGFTYSRATGRRISAVVPVHIFGNAARMQELVALCRPRNLKVVEDAAESLGTFYRGADLDGLHTGTFGDVGCFSFNGNKIITTGGGGMIVSNNRDHAELARYLTTQAKDDEVRYVHNEIGYNFRLTNVQAAMGVAQLERLPEFLETKRRNYLTYQEAVDGIAGLALGEAPPYARNNHWMYPLQIDAKVYGADRERVMARLTGLGIQTRPVWHLNHLQLPYLSCRHYRIEKALALHGTTLCLPCSVNLKKSEIDFVIEALRHG
jgi:perosamine synthetase